MPPQPPSPAVGPSFDDIVAHFASTDREVVGWLAEYRRRYPTPDQPLSLAELLDFGFGMDIGAMSDAAYEKLMALLEDGLVWGLSEWLSRTAETVPVAERVIAAVELTSSWWRPVLRAEDAEVVERLLRQVREVHRDPAAAREPLRVALDTWAGLPPSKPPPPYVGHYCGAVRHLLEAVLNPPNYGELAACLDYVTVAPDGSRRRAEIAAVLTG